MQSINDRPIRSAVRTGPLLAALALTVSAACAQAALPAEGITLETYGRYRAADDGPYQTFIPGGGSTTLRSQAGPGPFPSTTQIAFVEGAIAEARSSLPGTFGTYANAGGYSPSFAPPAPEGLEARAHSSQVSWWQVRSNNPAVTSVAVNVLAFYDGTLYTGDFAGVTQAGRLYATVDTRLAAETAAGALYELALTARLDDVGGLSASPAWAGSWASQTVGSGFSEKRFAVQYTDYFANAFVVPVNTTFAWISELTSEAVAPGPFELFAQSNFLSTGSFTLSISSPDAELTLLTLPAPVPEPGQFALLAAGLGCLVARRALRRRS
jgi:hypothetical protein